MQLDKLTFFKRQSHLLMDEPQIVILKHGLSLNSAFSKKITQSGYKRCKLALDVKDDDYSKANNLYIILTNEEIENGGNILPLTHPQRNMGTIRYFVACKELIDRVPRFDAMRCSSSRSERRLFVKQLQEDIFQVVIEANFENEVQDYKDLPKKGGVYRYLKDGTVVEIGSSNNLRLRATQHKKDNLDFDQVQFSVIEDKIERLKVERKHLSAFKSKYGAFPKYNKMLPPVLKTQGGLVI
tara:strand:+ start:154 stop:873 length:720 start_codon:yes stop_codon:yes gene_type:complete